MKINKNLITNIVFGKLKKPSMQKIGQITDEELAKIKEEFLQFYHFSDLDNDYNPITEKFAKNNKIINEKYLNYLEELSCCEFVNKRFDDASVKISNEIFFKYFPKLQNLSKLLTHQFLFEKIPFISIFKAVYASVHSDKSSLPHVKGQIMIILENTHKVKILSEDKNKKIRKIVPKAGDIIYLDIHKRHACYPDKKYSINTINEHPMKFVAYCVM